MANDEHLARLRDGVEGWNRWKRDHLDTVPDLRKADLNDANLEGVNLLFADLRGASLSNANLRESELALVNLAGAYLHSTNFSGANLSGANLAGAAVLYSVFADVDLSDVEGLEAVLHGGPCTIGIDTIYRSKGSIPESFLRGCGVPNDFITFIKSLTTNPLQFYSCFISYSTKDQAFADRLYADLQNKGVRCWFAPHDVQGGRKLHEQIDEAIRLHDKLLLILSPHSMESEWVKTEIAKARKREVRDQRRVLFPIRLASFETLRDWECFDSDTGKDSAREIREYFIPDFSNWKNHDSYQVAFQRLISDLKASDARPPATQPTHLK
ncbi:MAG: toll/interleukin-1 receptor domain-containing protein [Candidatus Sulfotelmatobacter sp.]